MMMKPGWLLLLAASVAACGSNPPEDRYYSLVLDAVEAEVPQANGDAAVRVSLNGITLPPYLESRAMALQVGSNEIRVSQNHYWAEPLDEAIAKVLVRDIEKETTTIDVLRYQDGDVDCRLKIEFDRFHATDDARVLVSGRYWLISEEGAAKVIFDNSQSLPSSGYASAVSTLRESLLRLATGIAAAIESAAACQG